MDGRQVRVTVLGPDDPVRCASLLKPLYAWVAPETDRDDQRAAVVHSDNTATDRVVDRVGLGTLLGRVATLTGVTWEPAPTWGQVMVTRTQVETTYQALAKAHDDGDRIARQVLSDMTDIVSWQRFGTPPGVACKAGWDLTPAGAVTHLARVRDDGTVKVVLTVADVTDRWRTRWERLVLSDPISLAGMHENLTRHVLP